jgi:hypothetical protein
MKTTELFVEQILIGALVLAAGLLPWWPELRPVLTGLSGVLGLAGGAVALGAAYLLGIVFDRLADTLLEELERHQRLRFALAWPALREKEPPASASEWSDPFPEGALRLAALRDPGPVVEWLDYHRSRIRLSRALALFLPALTFAAVLAGARRPPGPDALNPAWMLVVPVVYAVVVWLSDRRGQELRTKKVQRPTWRLAPRTDRREAYWYARDTGLIAEEAVGRVLRRRAVARILLADPAVLGSLALLVGALALAAAAGARWLVAVAAAGAGLSGLSAWAWWRIGATYRTYLREAASVRRAAARA